MGSSARAAQANVASARTNMNAKRGIVPSFHFHIGGANSVAASFAVVNSGENGEHSRTLDEAAVKSARHNLRGRINALKLCVSAFEVLETHEERLEFLAMI